MPTQRHRPSSRAARIASAAPPARPVPPGRSPHGAGRGRSASRAEEPSDSSSWARTPSRLCAERLAGDEEPVPDGRDQRAERRLGPAVLRRHVEVVDPGGHGPSKAEAAASGPGVPEGGPTQHGHRRAVSRPPQSSHVPRLHRSGATRERVPRLGGGSPGRPIGRRSPALIPEAAAFWAAVPLPHHGTEPHRIVDVLLVGPLPPPAYLRRVKLYSWWREPSPGSLIRFHTWHTTQPRPRR